MSAQNRKSNHQIWLFYNKKIIFINLKSIKEKGKPIISLKVKWHVFYLVIKEKF